VNWFEAARMMALGRGVSFLIFWLPLSRTNIGGIVVDFYLIWLNQ